MSSRGLPSAPIKQHLRRLISSSGAGPKQIAAASGVSERTVRYVLDSPGDRRIYKRTAYRLMAVTRLEVSRRGSVPAFSAGRRVDALACLGWSRREIALRAGLKPRTLAPSNIGEECGCSPATLFQIASVYEQLRKQVAPGGWMTERTRRIARSLGYAPPWAWSKEALNSQNGRPDLTQIDDDEWRAACRDRYHKSQD